MAEQQKGQLQIRAKEEALKGNYSNLMQIAHGQEEFMLDFFMMSGKSGVLASRVVVSPGHLKRMISALQENLDKYESRFGKVTPAQTPQEGEIGFQI